MSPALKNKSQPVVLTAASSVLAELALSNCKQPNKEQCWPGIQTHVVLL
jgi:hypothetical protein